MKTIHLVVALSIAGFALLATPTGSWAQTYGAAAADIWESGNTNHASVGTGEGSTRTEAQSNALDSCMRNGAQNCRIVGNWSHGGCGFITVSTSGINGGVGWGAGSTAKEAYDTCYANSSVRQCDNHTIGFCSDRE